MRLIWSITDLVEIAKERQQNKFDVIIAVSGDRGNGKSSLLFRFFSRFKPFKAWNHQIYSRKDVMRLLEKNKFGCIFDDEAIRTGYKRNFFDADQKLLIQMINMYRDNFNVYGLAVPNFYSLDKDLRDLIKIHIHVVERGLGVVHIANSGNLYSDDAWDVKYNKKIEERWSESKKKNPNFKPKYNKLTTFRGYIRFPDLTPKQRLLYEEVKVTKRKAVYEEEMKQEEDGFCDRLIARLKKGELSTEALEGACIANKLKISSVRTLINTRLRDAGDKHRLTHYLSLPDKKKKGITVKESIEKAEKFGYQEVPIA